MGLNTGIQRGVNFLASYFRGEMALEQSEEEKRLKAEIVEARKRSDTRAEMELQAKLAEAAGKREQAQANRAWYEKTTGRKGDPQEVIDKLGPEIVKAQLQRSGTLPPTQKEEVIGETALYDSIGKPKYDEELNRLFEQRQQLQRQFLPGLYPSVGVFGQKKTAFPTDEEIAKGLIALNHTNPIAYRQYQTVDTEYRRLFANPDEAISRFMDRYLIEHKIPPHNVVRDRPRKPVASQESFGPLPADESAAGAQPPADLMNLFLNELKDF